jgi:hypothetical protein
VDEVIDAEVKAILYNILRIMISIFVLLIFEEFYRAENLGS